MMGRQPKVQNKLFYTAFNLEQRVRQDHILRKVKNCIDFDFIYNQVKDTYGIKGNISVAPPVILKMLFLLFFYNVRSERELVATIPERLDWLWFLDYDLDDEIPNHSVLSKARARWGVSAFRTFFDRIVYQCQDAGLIDGRKLFMDSSIVQADASNNSVIKKDSLKRYLNKSYQILESRLEKEKSNHSKDDDSHPPKSGAANKKHISTTDPDASVSRRGKGRSKLEYQIHRGVDPKCEVITTTEVTPGEVHEAQRMQSLIDTHEKNTATEVETAVGDSKYGTIDNFLACHDRGIKAHFPSLEQTQKGSGRQKDIFPRELFIYDFARDIFICPAGQLMKRRKYKKKRKHYEYSATAKICNNCHLRKQCTRSKTGRTLKRHVRQDDIDLMLTRAISTESKKDIQTRQHLMERSFARATRYGYKRARWRRLWRVQIQEYLTASIQNIMVFLRHVKEPAAALALNKSAKGIGRGSKSCPRGLGANHINNLWRKITPFSRTLKQGIALAFC
ncbi:MAG: IS1182 family transposase [Desulfobacterales bacterium]|nr:MAG: IS1182 family transposase [Desulfobacterales bacterium]